MPKQGDRRDSNGSTGFGYDELRVEPLWPLPTPSAEPLRLLPTPPAAQVVPDYKVRRILGMLPPEEFAQHAAVSRATMLDVDDGRYRVHKLSHQTWCADRGNRCVGHASTQEHAMRLVENDMSSRRDRMHQLLFRMGLRLQPETPAHPRGSHGGTHG